MFHRPSSFLYALSPSRKLTFTRCNSWSHHWMKEAALRVETPSLWTCPVWALDLCSVQFHTWASSNSYKTRRYSSHRTTDNLLRKVMVQTQPVLIINQHNSAAHCCTRKYHGVMCYHVHFKISHDIPTMKCANFSYWRRVPVIYSYHETYLYSMESQRDGCIAEPIKNFQTLGQFRNLFVYTWYRNSK
jgi:hypothetical protein